jgi:hypothetical protein
MPRNAPANRQEIQLPYPGAPQVTKASKMRNCANGPTAGYAPSPRWHLYPRAHWVTKAMATLSLDNMIPGYSLKRQLYPGAHRVTKATETLLPGQQILGHHATMYLQHHQATGLLHKPHHRLYPRAHWVNKATLWNKLGNRTLAHGTSLLALWQKPLQKQLG